ncbi:MAG: glycoside-pentoside-hexuronide (GPH):cation symporter [Eubacteriales bacterium]|nr:glycoside-pentoside-hexuronide (GPH):cation symporter [Eubacteriales bacterium]
MENKTSFKHLLSYSLGEVGCQASWYMVNTYLMLFYTDVVGLSAAAISMIMLIARVWDAVNDPMMGSIADRTNTKWGKFRPYLFAAPPFLAIFNILTFTVFPVQGTAKVIICLITYVGTGMMYTAVSIAYQSLQHVTAIDSHVRMNLATARGIGGAVVGIILSAVAMPTILYFSKSDVANATGYFWFTVILSIVMVPLFWLCALGCKETYTEQLHSGAAAEKMGFVKSLREIVKNDQLMMVVLATVLGAMCISGRMGILTYYIIYVVGDFTVIAQVFSVMTILQLIATITLPVGIKIFGKKGYMIVLNIIMMIGFGLLFINPECNKTYLLVVSGICGWTNSAAAICPGMVSDSIEYGDWKLGRRQEGIAASMLSFGVKISTAISGSAGVLLLAAAGYVAGAEQTPAAKQGINIVVNLVPLVLVFISIVPLFFYKLNDKKVAEIRADLDKGVHAYDK